MKKKKKELWYFIVLNMFLIEDKYIVDVGDLSRTLTLHVVDPNGTISDSD